MTIFIALLRAVNVGGRKVTMAELREVVAGLGYKDAQTYIASGNLVFSGQGTNSAVTAKLEKAIAAKFGIEVPVIVRTCEEWKAYLTVPKALTKPAAEKPNWVLIGFPKAPPRKEAVAELLARAKNAEEIVLAGDAIWFHYSQGVADSKLTPASIDKAAGSPLTARNWNTVRKLAEMAGVA